LQTASGYAAKAKTSADLIYTAFERGEISRDDRARFLAYSLFDPARLPVAFQSDEAERCGTAVLKEIQNEWAFLSVGAQSELSKYGMHPNGTLSLPTVPLGSYLKTTHFTIHYSKLPGDSNAVSLVDTDHNGTPDYIDTLAAILEHVWDYEINTMLYPAPPITDTDGRMPVFVFKIGRKYGLTGSDSLVGDNPNTFSRVETGAASSHIELRNEYVHIGTHPEIQNMEVTVAHEFFHTVSNGIDVYSALWLDEATATWMEDEVYDSVDDSYQYLPPWFARPDIPLNASNDGPDSNFNAHDHWYGSWIFLRYLSEHLGGEPTVRSIWDTLGNASNMIIDRSITSISTIVQQQSSDLPTTFSNFGATNLLLTIPPYDYREGSHYPSVIGHQTVTKDTTINDTLPRLATRYYFIDPSIANGIEVSFSYSGSATSQANIVEVTTDGIPSVIPVNPSAGLPQTTGLSRLAVMVSSGQQSGNHAYRLRIMLRSSFHISASAPLRTTGFRPYTYVLNYDGPGLSGTDTIGYRLIRFTVPPGTSFVSASPRYGSYNNGQVSISFFVSGETFRDSERITVRAQPSCNLDTVVLRNYSIEDQNLKVSGNPVKTVITSSRYVLTILQATPWRVNLKRQVVGTVSAGQPYGWFWNNGKYTTLAGPDSTAVSASYAYDINDIGQVPCTILDRAANRSQYVWTLNDSITGKGTWNKVGSDAAGMTYAINNSGQVVGSGLRNQRLQACLWQEPPVFFDTLEGSLGSEAFSINNTGAKAGEITISQNNSTRSHEAIWDGITPSLIDNSPTEYHLTGPGRYIAINNRKEIVGSSGQDPSFLHAYRWSGGKHDLGTFPGGTFSWAFGINNFGEVAGTSDGITPSKPYSLMTGCIWVGDKIVDLNCLVDLQPGDRINQATDINDSGVIVGVIKRGADYYGFIMSPDSSSLSVETPSLPAHDFSLAVYPNPIREKNARIQFELDRSEHVRLDIFDELGRHVTTVADCEYPSGPHELNFDTKDCEAASYIARLETTQGVQSARLVITR